ncbi:MAG TPA: AAA family ATPase [Vicinamibacterales bacterium]|nr:AAA family ATPase [Vicinamibacterales bacterium]
MTERLQRLVMHAFRGVPTEMTVDFGNGESTVIYGENGTGKSTIADALEWYFKGEIELLSHEGRQHAVRYVGGDDDGTTSVEVVTSGALGGKAVFPDERTPDRFEALRRETFLLRGRTLADFINKTKTEKWKALVEILGLDAIESLREDLQRARNDLRKASKAADEEVRVYRRALASGGDTVSEDTVLANLRQICELLGVDPPQSLEQVAEPSWITAAVGASSSGSASSGRENLLAEIEALKPPDFNKSVFESWNKLVVSDRARLLPRASLVREAKRLIDAQSIEAGRCPLCGQKVDQKVLARRIESSLVEMMEASRDLERFRDPILEQAEGLESSYQLRDVIYERGHEFDLEVPSVPALPDTRIEDQVGALAPVDVDGITTYLSEVRRWDKAVGKLAKQISTPEPSERDNQLMMLAALCQQIRAWQQAEKKSAHAKRAVTIAEDVFDAYQQKQKNDLGELLEQISGRVAKFYSALHPGEDLDSVSIEPWTAKGIELAIDFYGSRQRPPHGVLSESHLNSLAIAVFLAMAASFNEKLGFLILDDVINSFDVEHRGRLAELLADGFSDWQLIVLTHDQQFFEHLSRRAPSWRKIEFTSWSHASGPRTTKYETSGMLAAARERLQHDDVHGAATKARRALEELLQEVCEALSAPLPFRRGQANDRREIGELFIGLRRALKEHAKSQLQSIEPIFKHLEADVGATLNVAAHASRGRSGASEVKAALERIETLDALWSCPDCRTRIWHKGTPDAARCRCGKSAFPPVVVA